MNNTAKTAKIFEIKRFAVHDGDGIRTTVFFKGCPLRCVWCHNPEGLIAKNQLAYYAHKCIGCGECASVCPSGAHEFIDGKHTLDRSKCLSCGRCTDSCFVGALTLFGRETTVEELLPTLLEDKDFYENSGGGVTLSGGECLAQADFCAELLCRLKENGVSTAVDTCGMVSRESIDKVIPYTDVFLYDLKAFSRELHEKCTGVPNEKIIENLKYLDSVGAKIEIRIPLVPDFNECELEDMAQLLSTLKNILKIRVLAYHKYAGSKYEALDMPLSMPERTPSEEQMQRAKELIERISRFKVTE